MVTYYDGFFTLAITIHHNAILTESAKKTKTISSGIGPVDTGFFHAKSGVSRQKISGKTVNLGLVVPIFFCHPPRKLCEFFAWNFYFADELVDAFGYRTQLFVDAFDVDHAVLLGDKKQHERRRNFRPAFRREFFMQSCPIQFAHGSLPTDIILKKDL
jgi:hypothetical protein